MAQLKLSHQQVVACLGQVFLRLVELALGIKYVDVDTYAHFIAQQISFQGALAGSHRSLQCLDLSVTRLHTQKSSAHRLRNLAFGSF